MNEMHGLVMRAFKHALLFALFLLIVGCSPRVELLSEVQEAEANDVLAALADANIQAEKVPGKEGMVKLMIDQAHVARAISALNDEGLPRRRYATMGDVFRKEGLISSPLEEKARYLWALSQELSSTIAEIDGVLKARVHVVLPERSVGSEPAMPSSAAVFIKHRREYSIETVVPQIKQLVSNSVPGLSASSVSVVLIPAQPKPAVDPASHTAAPGALASVAASPRMLVMWAGLALGLLIVLASGAYLGWSLWKRKGKKQRPKNTATAQELVA